MRRSKFVAVVVMCALCMSVIQPAFAGSWSEFFFGSEPEPSWCESYWYIAAGAVIGAVMGGTLAIFTGGSAVLLISAGTVLGSVVGAAPSDLREDIAKKTVILAVAGAVSFWVKALLGTGAGVAAGVGTGAAGVALDR